MCAEINQFLEKQQFDTDCIEDDMETFEEENERYLKSVLRGDKEGMIAIQSLLSSGLLAVQIMTHHCFKGRAKTKCK